MEKCRTVSQNVIICLCVVLTFWPRELCSCISAHVAHMNKLTSQTWGVLCTEACYSMSALRLETVNYCFSHFMHCSEYCADFRRELSSRWLWVPDCLLTVRVHFIRWMLFVFRPQYRCLLCNMWWIIWSCVLQLMIEHLIDSCLLTDVYCCVCLMSH